MTNYLVNLFHLQFINFISMWNWLNRKKVNIKKIIYFLLFVFCLLLFFVGDLNIFFYYFGYKIFLVGLIFFRWIFPFIFFFVFLIFINFFLICSYVFFLIFFVVFLCFFVYYLRVAVVKLGKTPFEFFELNVMFVFLKNVEKIKK